MSTQIPSGKAGLNAAYGVPYDGANRLNPAWRTENIVSMKLPYPMRIAWDTDTTVTSIVVHKACVDDLTKIFTEIYAHARMLVKENDGYQYDTAYYDKRTMQVLRNLGLDLYGGAFNFRVKRGGKSLSTHSWGCAIDIDPEHNAMGDSTPKMPAWAVAIFKKYGWVWGGDWRGKSIDAMHFQRCKNI